MKKDEPPDLFKVPPVHHLSRRGDLDTSKEAAKSIHKDLRPLQKKVLDTLYSLGGEAIDETLCDFLFELKDSTVRTRRNELVVAGLVKDTGRKGETMSGRRATIWALEMSKFNEYRARNSGPA
jgi:hypothetical protein